MLMALRDAWRFSDRARLFGFSDNRRLCAKSRCKAWSEKTLRGRGLSAGLAGGSIFCIDHACRKVEQNGEFCKTATKRGQPYCEAHLQCRKPGCDNLRKRAEKKTYYCLEDHGCEHGDCANERLRRPDEEKRWRYCHEHTCEDYECNGFKEGPLVRFCRDHRCAHPSCSEYVRPNADPAKRDSHERYCEKDRPCKTTGCSERAHRLRSGKVLSHCKDHYCDYEHECDDERSVGGTGCEKHTCRDPGCNKKLTDTEAAIYCEDHECKTKQCWGRKYQNVVRSDRCTQHICRDYLRERCEKEGDVRYEYYCDLHQRCEVDGCNEARHQEKGVMRPRCQKHERGVCQWKVGGAGCSDEVHDKGSNFCTRHRCMAHTACPLQRTPFAPFCQNHKCARGACQNQRSTTGGGDFSNLLSIMIAVDPSFANMPLYAVGQFCDRHRCCAEGCDRERGGDDYPGGDHGNLGGGRFCVRHTCREEECRQEARLGGRDAGYCQSHPREDDSSEYGDEYGQNLYWETLPGGLCAVPPGRERSYRHRAGRRAGRRDRHRVDVAPYWVGPRVQW